MLIRSLKLPFKALALVHVPSMVSLHLIRSNYEHNAVSAIQERYGKNYDSQIMRKCHEQDKDNETML